MARDRLSPSGLRGGCDRLGLPVPTWVSLLGSKPLSGARTRPRRVSVSGELWFRSLNCRKEGDGNPCPTPPYPGFSCPQGSPFYGGVAPRELPLTISPPSGCGSTTYRGVRGATSASTCTTSPSGAEHSCESLVLASTHSPHCPVPPCSYRCWQRGCHSAAHALLSPGQRAAPPPHPHQDKQPAGSACTGSPGGH